MKSSFIPSWEGAIKEKGEMIFLKSLCNKAEGFFSDRSFILIVNSQLFSSFVALTKVYTE